MALEDDIAKLPPHELVTLKWHLQRRKSQTCPDPLPMFWFLLGGRGSGKTLTGSNHIYELGKNHQFKPGEKKIVRVALISETFTDVRITMIEGETGLRSIVPADLEIAWNRSLGEYKFFIPGSDYREVHCFAYSSERPELLRGPQHHYVWVDEPAKLKDADKEPTDPSTTWSNMLMGLRLGKNPHAVITGTPEPHKLIKMLVTHEDCVTHNMSSIDNWENLPEALKKNIERLPKTSRVYRQEVLAEILLDNPDSIISQESIDNNRSSVPEDKELHLVLGYDPSMTSNAESDESGIILTGYTVDEEEVVSRDKHGAILVAANGQPLMVKEKTTHAYILEDHSGHLDPTNQGKTVVDLILDRGVDELIFEQNQGAEFVLNNIKTALLNHKDSNDNSDIKEVHWREMKKKATKAGVMKRWRVSILFKDRDREPHAFIAYSIHAKVNKTLRADAVSIHYDMGHIHHPIDGLPICEVLTCKANLEDQEILWSADKKDSPDRMDAAVYTLLHIFGHEHALSNKRPARVSTAAKAADLPKYDPRSVLTESDPRSMTKHSKLYTMDIGGSSGEFDSPGLAGPRRIPNN